MKFSSFSFHKRFIVYVLTTYMGGVLLGAIAAASAHVLLVPHMKSLIATHVILHNSQVILLMLLGVLSWGIITLSVIFLNGLFLGITSGSFLIQGKLLTLLIAIAPYGVFEIGAYLLAAYGDLLMISVIHHFFVNQEKQISLKHQFALRSGIIANAIAFILVIIAGFIESSITTHL